MFQYAMLLGVSHKRGYQVAIPKRYIGTKKRGLVELKPFSISCAQLFGRDVSRLTNVFTYDDLIFNPKVFEQPDFTDYRGYYQSEKYFEGIKDKITSEFTFQPTYQRFAEDYIKPLAGGTILAIHVRRGDYLKNPHLFWVLSRDYYHNAIDSLPTRPSSILVFSDDIAWCKSNFSSDCHYVSTPSHWHDMAIMRLCDYFIISASSFSWWGAWLSKSPNKLVIAPDPWFVPNNRLHGLDLVPEGWQKLKAIHEDPKFST